LSERSVDPVFIERNAGKLESRNSGEMTHASPMATQGKTQALPLAMQGKTGFASGYAGQGSGTTVNRQL